MKRFMFTPPEVEATVAEVDTFRNDIAGAAAFFAGLTALQFTAPSQVTSVATSAFGFIMFWVLVKVLKYKSEHDRYYAGFGPLVGLMVSIIRNPILFVGLIFLGSIATGYLKVEGLSWFSLARIFNP